MAEPMVLRRMLTTARLGPFLCLDVLSWPTPLGAGLRMYFGRGAKLDHLNALKGGAARFTQVAPVAGSLVATGTLARADAPISLSLEGENFTLSGSSPETGLFDDCNVLLGERYHETAAQIAGWLGYHAADHGADAALLINRAPPGPETEAFVENLNTELASLDGLRRVVLVEAPVPLGLPGRPAQGDPATAPRASNRTPRADPWRAALGEPLLYDVLKWRFLTRAGAVLALDPPDMLDAASDGISVFDTCRQSQNGLIVVSGEFTFAWRIRKDQLPVHGDHLCKAVPPISAPNRWCVAPKRTGPDTLWLPGNIAGLAAIEDETAGYTRAASMLYPASKPAELVDKARLVEDAALLRRANERLGHDPVRPPKVEKATPALPDAAPSGRTVIVTCMKNEGPFILEWLAFHRMIGVDDFLIYTNDCDDGTEEMLNLLQSRGIVQRRDNPFREAGVKPQAAALEAAQSEPLVQQAGWIVSMDVDEFLNIHAGNGRLADLYAAVPDASAISVTWRLFGNSDIDTYADHLITEQFTRCAPQLIRRPHQAWGFKTLFRNTGLFTSFGVHRPKGYQGQQALWVNGSGKPMPPAIFKTGWRSNMDTYGYDLVTLNHYSVRNCESFLVKRDRGRVNHVTRDQGPAYWMRMNNNDEQDLSIQRMVPDLRRALDELMADPQIAAAHAASVAAHRARIAELRALPDYAALYDQITGKRMKRMSRMHRHFGMNVFLQGPSAVPDRVFDEDLPEGFFFNVEPPTGRAAD